MTIAVLDDSPEEVERLLRYLERFQEERGVSFQVDPFYSSLDFLEEYRSGYDVIFLDIEMPGNNGLEVAKEIREKDETAGILFITNMAQYAIRGYEVDAIDFMVKPVGYFNFAKKLEKAIRYARRRSERYFLLSDESGLNRVPASAILYIEKNKNYLVYHTERGTFQERGTMQGLKETLQDLPFSESMTGCLVNLNYVERIGKETVLVGKSELPLSRRLKKQFTQDYVSYMGGAF